MNFRGLGNDIRLRCNATFGAPRGAAGANDVKTTVMPGRGVETFKTAGIFKLEAVGDPHHRVKYGYVLLHLKNE